MTLKLTKKAIKSSKKTAEISSKPVLSTSQFMENVTKLKNHFNEIEIFREKILLEAKEKTEQFNQLTKKLGEIKIMNNKTQEEFILELNK